MFFLKADPDALSLGGVDKMLEAKIKRKNDRQEAEAKRREKERLRVLQMSQPTDGDDDSDDNEDNKENRDDDDNNDDDDDDDSEDYQPAAHRRKYSENITLSFNVKELQHSFANIADRHGQSSRARSDLLTNVVEKGGGNIRAVASSQRSMVK